MNAEPAMKKPRLCKCCGLEGHDRRNCPVKNLTSPNCSYRVPAVFHSGGEIVAAPPGAHVDPLIYDEEGSPIDKDGNHCLVDVEVPENDVDEQRRFAEPETIEAEEAQNEIAPPIITELDPFAEAKWIEFPVPPLPLTMNRSGSFPASIFPEISQRGYNEKGFPKYLPKEHMSPAGVMELFFDDFIINTFVDQTNSFTHHSKDHIIII